MTEQLKKIPITSITPNPYQPRKQFAQDELDELAQSIRENGLIQPIIVRQSPLSGYDLVAGERRFRASQLAGLTEILAVVKEMTDTDSMKQAIIENLQRSDLNPIEEALAYQQLMLREGLTHEEIASGMGKSRPYITNSLRLLSLSPKGQEALADKLITPGHARLILSLSKPEQENWLDTIITQQLTVRQLEQALKTRPKKSAPKKDAFIADQEQQLKQALGRETTITLNASGQGSVTIHFSDLDDFHKLIHKLS